MYIHKLIKISSKVIIYLIKTILIFILKK